MLLFGLGERKQRRQRLASTPVCDKGISETPSRDKERHLLLLLLPAAAACASAWCWHTFPRQQRQPGIRALTIAFLHQRHWQCSASSPRPGLPPLTHTACSALSCICTYVSTWRTAWITWGPQYHTQPAGTSALQRAGFVREGWTEKLNLMLVIKSCFKNENSNFFSSCFHFYCSGHTNINFFTATLCAGQKPNKGILLDVVGSKSLIYMLNK